MFPSQAHRSRTNLETQGDGQAHVIRKRDVVASNEMIKVFIHNLNQCDPIPPRGTGERNRVLPDKRTEEEAA